MFFINIKTNPFHDENMVLCGTKDHQENLAEVEGDNMGVSSWGLLPSLTDRFLSIKLNYWKNLSRATVTHITPEG